MRIAYDMSSVCWTSLLVGKDAEGVEVVLDEKKYWVNSAEYGYENAVNLMLSAMEEANCVPSNIIMVVEGLHSKKRRTMISAEYKANRGTRPLQQNEQFNKLLGMLVKAFKDRGAIAVSQDYVEGDDVLAWLAENSEEDLRIVTNDNDLVCLHGKNAYGADISVRVGGVLGKNKYGPFDLKLVTLYKTLVGDSSDNIKGAQGFGPKAFEACLLRYDEDGLEEILKMIQEGRKDDLAVIAEDNNCKYLRKIVEEWNDVQVSYRLALLHPEWVNTVRQQLVWSPGMVVAAGDDSRLMKYRGQTRLVGSANFDAALDFLKLKMGESEYVTIDFETTVPEESDDWLEAKGKKGVDVIGSTIVSCGISFGRNNQYGYYVTVDHAESDNCTLEQLGVILASIPQSMPIVAHNAAGFELPVAYNAFGTSWKDNGWRGFIPNMVDSRIAASFWDENQTSHGLKQLSKLLLGYEQDTYEKTTTKTGEVGTLTGGQITRSWEEGGKLLESRQYKMDQLTAAHVTAYGLDDCYTASGLWNFFKLFMQLDHTYKAFNRLEQKPMYLSALSFCQGMKIDTARLKMLESQDEVKAKECWGDIETFLIEKGWDGTQCPIYTELTPANIKQAVSIVTGLELTTMIRTQSKLAILVGGLDHPDAEILSKYIEANDIERINKLVFNRFSGRPVFNVGSPKQISNLLYDVIKMPVRLRNKPTPKMREEGKREGTARTDDDAIAMAIKMGDVQEREKRILSSMLEMKSCNTRSGLYWKPYPNLVHWKTGLIHPELRQSSTNTRRWTSANPNIQQTERDPDGVRSCLVAGHGKIFLSLDESSQEVRQMADYCRDTNLLGCYIGDHLRDTHSIVGARIAKVTYEEFMVMRKAQETKDYAGDIRTKSKVVLFATLYGASAPKIGETLGISAEEAQSYIDAIFKEFPDIKKWKEDTEKHAEQYGWVPIAGGTKRHLAKLITSEDKYEASKALRQAGNARIQGAGANQLKAIMVAIWESNLIENYDYQWVFPCHDETCHIVSKKDAVEVTSILHGFMTAQFLDLVGSESSIGVGRNYGQLNELGEKFDAELLAQAVAEL